MSSSTAAAESKPRPLLLEVMPGASVGPVPFGLPLFQFVDTFLCRRSGAEELANAQQQQQQQQASETQNRGFFADFPKIVAKVTGAGSDATASDASPARADGASTDDASSSSMWNGSRGAARIAPLFADATVSHPRFPGQGDIEIELPACGLILCFDARSHRFVSAWFTPQYATAAVDVLVGGAQVCRTHSTTELPTLRRIVDVLGPTQPGQFRGGGNSGLYDVVYPGCVVTFDIPPELRQELIARTGGSAPGAFQTQQTAFRDGRTPVAQRIVWHSMEPGAQVTRGLRLAAAANQHAQSAMRRSASMGSGISSPVSAGAPSSFSAGMGGGGGGGVQLVTALSPNASVAEVAVASWAAATLAETNAFLAAEVMPGVGVRFHCRPPPDDTFALPNDSTASAANITPNSRGYLNSNNSGNGGGGGRSRHVLRTCEVLVGMCPQDVVTMFGQPQIVWPHISKADNVIGHAVMLVVSRQAHSGNGSSGSGAGSSSGGKDGLPADALHHGGGAAATAAAASIGASSGASVAAKPGFSFCYPALGFNVVFNSSNRVESVMLSNAAPGHEYFLRYARCPFALFGSDAACLNMLGITMELEDPQPPQGAVAVTVAPPAPVMSAVKSAAPAAANAPGGKKPGVNNASVNASNSNNGRGRSDERSSDTPPPPLHSVPVVAPVSSSNSSTAAASSQNTTVRKVFDSYSVWTEVAGHIAGTAREKLRRIPLSTANEEQEAAIVERAARIPPGLSITAPEGALRVVPLHGLCFTVTSAGAIAAVQVGRVPRRMAKTTVGRTGHRIKLPVRSDASAATAATAEPRMLAIERERAAAGGGSSKTNGAGGASSSAGRAGGALLVVDDVVAEFDDCEVSGEDDDGDDDGAGSSSMDHVSDPLLGGEAAASSPPAAASSSQQAQPRSQAAASERVAPAAAASEADEEEDDAVLVDADDEIAEPGNNGSGGAVNTSSSSAGRPPRGMSISSAGSASSAHHSPSGGSVRTTPILAAASPQAQRVPPRQTGGGASSASPSAHADPQPSSQRSDDSDALPSLEDAMGPPAVAAARTATAIAASVAAASVVASGGESTSTLEDATADHMHPSEGTRAFDGEEDGDDAEQQQQQQPVLADPGAANLNRSSGANDDDADDDGGGAPAAASSAPTTQHPGNVNDGDDDDADNSSSPATNRSSGVSPASNASSASRQTPVGGKAAAKKGKKGKR